MKTRFLDVAAEGCKSDGDPVQGLLPLQQALQVEADSIKGYEAEEGNHQGPGTDAVEFPERAAPDPGLAEVVKQPVAEERVELAVFKGRVENIRGPANHPVPESSSLRFPSGLFHHVGRCIRFNNTETRFQKEGQHPPRAAGQVQDPGPRGDLLKGPADAAGLPFVGGRAFQGGVLLRGTFRAEAPERLLRGSWFFFGIIRHLDPP